MVLLSIVLAAGVFCAGCSSAKDEILLEEQEGISESENQKVPKEAPEISEVPEVTQEPQQIFVDVCGAVNQPGVYEMDPDSRVFQAIEAAGGMREDASGISVNQAQTLSDGQQIYVPTVQEAEERKLVPQTFETQETETGMDAASEDGLVDLNTADAQTLKTLSGIGDSKAQAILAYREEHGAFSSIEEIMQVPGIKESTFSKIKDKIAAK